MPEEKGTALVSIARGSVERHLGHSRFEEPDMPWLREPGATFVTLTLEGMLRGCIGSIEASRPLGEDVRRNALAAAFSDMRFAPLTLGELIDTRFEVSLLSPMVPLQVESEGDLVSRLEPGRDGVLLEWHNHRGTFLPQVWEQLPDPRDFVRHLKRKAGLRDDFWSGDLIVRTYGVSNWSEEFSETGAGRDRD